MTLKRINPARLLVYLSLLSLLSGLLRAYEGPVGLPTDAYGAPGPYVVERSSFANPDWPAQTVTVYSPVGAPGRRPVWFVAHGFGATDPEVYRELTKHLASHGAIVVYSAYTPLVGGRPDIAYSMMFDGFVAATKRWSEKMDTSRVGFVGHSYGGGAVPWLALKAWKEKTWGSEGLALLILAPWYSYFVTDADLASFPKQTKALVQVYEDDVINDHRMAIDLFQHLNVSKADKDFLMIRSDRVESYNYEASHRVPTGEGAPDNRSEYNAFDAWGVERLAVALGEAAWFGDAEAAKVALGNGSAAQIDLGTSPSGRVLRKQLWSDDPVTTYPQAKYKYPFEHDMNPRSGSYQPRPRRGGFLGGLSARARAEEGSGTFMIGAWVEGSAPKSLLIRALGPAFGAQQVTGFLPDPVLRLYRGAAADVDLDDWAQAPSLDSLESTCRAIGALPLDQGSRDAALLLSVEPGLFSAHVAVKAGQSGVSLLEMYDVEESSSSTLRGLSARAQVGQGDDILAAGFVVQGERMRILIRGLGPALSEQGVSEPLADPVLRVYQSGVLIAENDDWSGESTQKTRDLEEAMRTIPLAVPAYGSKDAGLVLDCDPGAYTVHVFSRSPAKGVGLVEVYSLGPKEN